MGRFVAVPLRHNGYPKAIHQVVIEMIAACTKGLNQNFENARVLYDEFQVSENVVEACELVWKAESRADTGKRNRLERTRWMWLEDRVNWTEKEAPKGKSMALEQRATGMAYKMLLVLQGIDERKDAGEARKLFRNWCAWVQTMRGQTKELVDPMD